MRLKNKPAWVVSVYTSASNGGETPPKATKTVLFPVFEARPVIHRAVKWPRFGSAFEYWFNCLFLWQTHTSQAVVVNPSLAGFVSTLFPVLDLRSIQKLKHFYWCLCVLLVPLWNGVHTYKRRLFLQCITRYFHSLDLSLWSCTKTKCCILSTERETFQ